MKYAHCQRCKGNYPVKDCIDVLHGRTDHVDTDGRTKSEMKNSFYCKTCFNNLKRKVEVDE